MGSFIGRLFQEPHLLWKKDSWKRKKEKVLSDNRFYNDTNSDSDNFAGEIQLITDSYSDSFISSKALPKFFLFYRIFFAKKELILSCSGQDFKTARLCRQPEKMPIDKSFRVFLNFHSSSMNKHFPCQIHSAVQRNRLCSCFWNQIFYQPEDLFSCNTDILHC